MHITLTAANKEKILRASGALNRSATDIVNIIIDTIDTIEIEEHIAVKLVREHENLPSPPNPDRKTKLRKSGNWVVRL